MPRGSHLYFHSLFTDEGLRHGELGDFELEKTVSSVSPRSVVSPQNRAKQKWVSIFQMAFDFPRQDGIKEGKKEGEKKGLHVENGQEDLGVLALFVIEQKGGCLSTCAGIDPTPLKHLRCGFLSGPVPSGIYPPPTSDSLMPRASHRFLGSSWQRPALWTWESCSGFQKGKEHFGRVKASAASSEPGPHLPHSIHFFRS